MKLSVSAMIALVQVFVNSVSALPVGDSRYTASLAYS